MISTLYPLSDKNSHCVISFFCENFREQNLNWFYLLSLFSLLTVCYMSPCYLYTSVWVHVPLHTCRSKCRMTSALFYDHPPYSFETGYVSESGVKLVTTKPLITPSYNASFIGTATTHDFFMYVLVIWLTLVLTLTHWAIFPSLLLLF